jgi:hypothetical protein
MVAWIAIGLPDPIKPPGIGRGIPSFANWLAGARHHRVSQARRIGRSEDDTLWRQNLIKSL